MTFDRSTPPLSSLYQALILDHYKRPRNKGALEAPDRDVHMRNPSCGDDIHLQLALDGDRVTDLRFEGVGCSISQASVSMLTQLVRGKSRAEALRLADRFTAMMHGDVEAARDRDMGDLRALAGVSRFPVRVKCALLGWNALEEALEQEP
jgi:nitrogen fixation protein NifU and related proteins